MDTFYVYVLSSRSRTLYVGVTNDVERRLAQHKAGLGSQFTAKYHIHRLVYAEAHASIAEAITREKQIKGWSREKKVAMIESTNPAWEDLSAEDV